MANNIFVVFTNPVEGDEDAYNDWYTNTHLPDVLKIPGVKSAARYKLADIQMVDQDCKFRYLAIYDLDTDDLTSVRDEIVARIGTDRMQASAAMSTTRDRFFFLPIAEMSN